MADVPDKQIKRLRALIQEAETNLAAANELLISLVGDDERVAPIATENTLGKVIEGVFDGQNMVGSDGKIYPVPANYASKSKLVQGDILKLTIADDGAFMYKQIGPIPRRQVVGVLNQKTNQSTPSGPPWKPRFSLSAKSQQISRHRGGIIDSRWSRRYIGNTGRR